MVDINIKMINYAMMQVDCEPGTARELSDYFSFFVPGYRFIPAYKNKMWDGKIRLYNGINGELNAGLFVYLIKFCKERGYSFEAEETDYGLPSDRTDSSLLKIDELQVEMKVPFPARDYQVDAWNVGITRKRAILLSPTGTGKSFIIYGLIRWYMRHNQLKNKIIVIVPTTSLVEQMTQDLLDYGFPEELVHKIYSGKDKNTPKPVIITTWQSVYKLPKKWFEKFGMVIGDECHGFKSKSLSSIMNKSINAEYRFGTTGTLDGTLTHKLVLEGLFGPVYQVTTTKAQQDQGNLAKLDISMITLKHDEETAKKMFGRNVKTTYQQEMDYIVKHETRNRFIRNLALQQTGNTLVLFQYVDKHGKVLLEDINNHVSEGRKVFFVSGGVAATDREAIRKIIETQDNAIIVASMGTFSTGINIKNLHNIIFASPSKSQIKVLQSIGRGLRNSDDGSTTKLFDLADDLSSGKKNFTLKHSEERIKIYNKEEFPIKHHKVNI